MSDIKLTRPAAAATVTIEPNKGDNFAIAFDPSEAVMTQQDGGLVFTFEDGAQLVVANFYGVYSKDEAPSFSFEDTVFTAQEFFAAQGAENLMPAAGPGQGQAQAASADGGGRYSDYGDAALLNGLNKLGGLDYNFTLESQQTERIDTVGLVRDDGGAAGIDHPVTIEPATPFDPSDTPGIDIPVFRSVSSGQDLIAVSENSLRDGGKTTVSSHLTITAPDGVATITIGDTLVYAGGEFTPGITIPTEGGTLTVVSFASETGILEYKYEFDTPVEHDGEGEDRKGEQIPVKVVDSDGDEGESAIVIVVKDDVPDAVDDNIFVKETADGEGTVTGNVMDNDIQGADGALVTSITAPDGSTHSVSDSRNGTTVEGEHGTLTIHPDGTYTYELHEDVPEGTSVTDTFTYTLTDSDGDTDTAQFVVTSEGGHSVPSVTPDVPTPDPDDPGHPDDPDNPDTPGNPDGPYIPSTPDDPNYQPEAGTAYIVADEGARKEGSGQHDAHGYKGHGSVEVALNGEDGTITFGSCTIVIKDGKVADFKGGTVSTENGVAVTLARSGVTTDDGGKTWNLAYSYELKGAQTHDRPAHDTTLSDTMVIGVADATGDKAAGRLVVEVHDDVPSISVEKTSQNAAEGRSVTGIFTPDFGADGAAHAASVALASDPAHGSVTLADNGDGTWTYTYTAGAVAGDAADSFVIRVTDADGDTAEQTVTVAIKDSKPTITPDIPTPEPDDPGKPDNPDNPDTPGNPDGPYVPSTPEDPNYQPEAGAAYIVADEGALPGAGSGVHDAHGYKGSGNVVVTLNGDDGTITFGSCTIVVRDGSVAEFSGGTFLTENGVAVTLPKSGVTTDDGGETWNLAYSYELKGAQTHDRPEHDTTLSNTITIGVTDA